MHKIKTSTRIHARAYACDSVISTHLFLLVSEQARTKSKAYTYYACAHAPPQRPHTCASANTNTCIQTRAHIYEHTPMYHNQHTFLQTNKHTCRTSTSVCRSNQQTYVQDLHFSLPIHTGPGTFLMHGALPLPWSPIEAQAANQARTSTRPLSL